MNSEFFRAMLKKTCAAHAIDRSRVYATGHSHGSVMTQVLAMAMKRGIRGGRALFGYCFSNAGYEYPCPA